MGLAAGVGFGSSAVRGCSFPLATFVMGSHDRLACLREEVKAAVAAPGFTGDVPGLRLRIDALEQAGADRSLLRLWAHGRPLAAEDRHPVQVRNHPSLLAGIAWAEKEWERLGRLGKVTFFPVGAPRPPRLNVNPCALILKPRAGVPDSASDEERLKACLIVDLKRGRVNERLPWIGVAYGTVELAISRMSKNDFLFVLDLQDSFFNWRVAPEDTWELGFYAPGRRQFGKYDYFPFGLASSPGVNDESLKEVLRLLEEHTCVELTDFVDDLLGRGSTEAEAWEALEKAVRFLLRMGLPVSSKPTGILAPAQRQIWTGWVFDTVACTVAATPDKCRKCQDGNTEVLDADDQRQLHASKLASVTGLASHIAEVYPQGRRRLHSVWADLNASGVYAMWALRSGGDPVVRLSELSRRNLAAWRVSLETPPSRPLHSAGGSLSAWGYKSPEFANWQALARQGLIQVIETDASKTVGWSYHLCGPGRVASGTWPTNFAQQQALANANEICFKELWVVERCLWEEAELLRGWWVLFRVDNAATVHYVNVRYGDVPSLEALAVRVEAAERHAGCWALALHLRGIHNRVADCGSRDPGFAGRWAADEFSEERLRPDLHAEIAGRCGVCFTLDLFADRAGLYALAPAWRSRELTAFEAQLCGEVVWAHPPRTLVRSVLEHFREARKSFADLQVALLLPEDTRAPWFRPQLLCGWHRVRSWQAGSDLFRWAEPSWRAPGGTLWRKGPRSDLPYVVLQSWAPASKRGRQRSDHSGAAS